MLGWSFLFQLGHEVERAKPQAVCFWAFEVLGLEPDDVLDDLFPGSGAVGRAWEAWRRQGRLALAL
jgi:hypothetical protein